MKEPTPQEWAEMDRAASDDPWEFEAFLRQHGFTYAWAERMYAAYVKDARAQHKPLVTRERFEKTLLRKTCAFKVGPFYVNVSLKERQVTPEEVAELAALTRRMCPDPTELRQVLWGLVRRDARGAGLKHWRELPYSLWADLMARLETQSRAAEHTDRELTRLGFRRRG